jgi:hypothetical protein
MTEYNELVMWLREFYKLDGKPGYKAAADALEAQAKEIAERDARIAELEDALIETLDYIDDPYNDLAIQIGALLDRVARPRRPHRAEGREGMTDYSELIKQARAVPGPTLLMTYPAQTTPDPLSNALADAIEALQNRLTFESAANLATAKLNANLLKRISELEAALKPFAEIAPSLEKLPDNYLTSVAAKKIRAARAALKGEKE